MPWPTSWAWADGDYMRERLRQRRNAARVHSSPWPCSRLLPLSWWPLCLHRFPVPACWPLSIGLPPRGGGCGEAAGGRKSSSSPRRRRRIKAGYARLWRRGGRSEGKRSAAAAGGATRGTPSEGRSPTPAGGARPTPQRRKGEGTQPAAGRRGRPPQGLRPEKPSRHRPQAGAKRGEARPEESPSDGRAAAPIGGAQATDPTGRRRSKRSPEEEAVAGRKVAGLRADDERGRHWRAFRFCPDAGKAGGGATRTEDGGGRARLPPMTGGRCACG